MIFWHRLLNKHIWKTDSTVETETKYRASYNDKDFLNTTTSKKEEIQVCEICGDRRKTRLE